MTPLLRGVDAQFVGKQAWSSALIGVGDQCDHEKVAVGVGMVGGHDTDCH